MRYLFFVVVPMSLLGACTETPSSFPPCVYTAPCPDQDASADADAATLDGSDATPAPDGGAE